MKGGFMDSWISFLVSTVLAVISIGFNLWQHHTYSNRVERLCGSLNAWWGWARSMRENIDRYWDFAGRNPKSPELIGNANGTIQGLAAATNHLAADIQKTCVALGFPDPYDKSWIKRKDSNQKGEAHKAASD
jgi:hypothetical protein